MTLYPWISDRRKLRKSKIPYNILYMWHSRRHNLIRNRNDNRRVLYKCRSFRSNFWHLRCPTGNDIQKQKTTGTGICTTTNLVIYTNGLRQHAGRRRLDGTSGGAVTGVVIALAIYRPGNKPLHFIRIIANYNFLWIVAKLTY